MAPRGRRRWTRRSIAGAALLTLTACGATGVDDRNAPDQPLPVEVATTSTGARPGPDAPRPTVGADGHHTGRAGAAEPADAPVAGTELPVGIEPQRIEIPAIGVDAVVIDLDLRGPEPEVPDDFAHTGWYTQTRRPGEIGPAVVAGHIDSVAGPAVFHRLDELVAGDEIIVSDTTGDSRTFVVTDAGQYPKEALPDEVFGFEPVVALRLITCGGTFDRSVGHYRDNYVVYAELAPDS